MGHFYSPYPDLKDVERRRDVIFNRDKRDIPGIDIRESQQLALLEELAAFYPKLADLEGAAGARFSFDNGAYSHSDAAVLFCMLNYLKPKRVIEIGSGYSSALMIDTDQLALGGNTEFTFIEPYPQLLTRLVGEPVLEQNELIAENLSEVDGKVFDRLESGDILFVDSTHVSKAGSDVNQVFFEIIPRLAAGTIIHVHDVFYPFEYPEEWITETRAWNEDYLLRAFLCDNEKYEILFFNHFMNIHHGEEMASKLPRSVNNPGGSLWLRKLSS